MAQALSTISPSYDELFSHLEEIRLEYRRIDQGYRLALYQLMAKAIRSALAIEADHASKDQFLKSVGQKSDVVYAAMIFITEAKSEGARKKASKGARALRYLVDQVGVPLDNIPEAIGEHGGVEKLARLAAQHLPRKKQPLTPKPEVVGEAETGLAEPGAENGEGQPGTHDVAKIEPQIQLDGDPEILATLVDFADNSAIQITGVLRVRAGMQLCIEVEDITDNAEVARDWEE